MSFKDLKSVPEFTKLHSQRAGILSCLDSLKEGLAGLSTEKPSWRSFSGLETNIEAETANLHGITKKIGALLTAKGGEFDDSDFVEYGKKASALLSEIEKARGDYYELLSKENLVPLPPKQEISGDLLGLLKSLTDAQNANQGILKSLTDTQRAAVEAQTSSNKTHKRKEMEQPKFDPIHVRHDPLAFKAFYRKLPVILFLN